VSVPHSIHTLDDPEALHTARELMRHKVIDETCLTESNMWYQLEELERKTKYVDYSANANKTFREKLEESERKRKQLVSDKRTKKAHAQATRQSGPDEISRAKPAKTSSSLDIVGDRFWKLIGSPYTWITGAVAVLGTGYYLWSSDEPSERSGSRRKQSPTSDNSTGAMCLTGAAAAVGIAGLCATKLAKCKTASPEVPTTRSVPEKKTKEKTTKKSSSSSFLLMGIVMVLILAVAVTIYCLWGSDLVDAFDQGDIEEGYVREEVQIRKHRIKPARKKRKHRKP